MAKNEVEFTPNMATAVIDVHHRITMHLKEEHGLPFLPCCVLASLRSHGGTMLIPDFPSAMISNENTVVAAAIRLEQRGLVEKTRRESDRRVVVLHETPEGAALVKRAFDGVYRQMTTTVWRRYSDGSIDEVLQALHASAAGLGISDIEVNHEVHETLTPAFFMAIASLVRQWTQAASIAGSTSLTEYRCLALLEDRRKPLPCSELADTLLIDRSTVSAAVKSLLAKRLVRVKRGKDGRQRIVSATESGKANAARAKAELEKRTAACYADAAPQLRAKANEVYARMYIELAEWTGVEGLLIV